MNYFAWALPFVSGLSDAASRAIFKATTLKETTLVASAAFFTAPFYAAWLYFAGIPIIGKIFWPAALFHAALLIFAQILTIKAHRSSPLILTMPYLSFTPAFLLITSPFMGGGKISVVGIFGVLLITFSLYIINVRGDTFKLLDPLRAFMKERGSQLMLLVAFIYSFTANLDFIALKNSSVPFYLFVDGLLIGLGALLLMFCGKVFNNNKEPLLYAGSFKFLIFVGAFALVASVSHMLAFLWIPYVPYVIAVKRVGAIFFTIGLGLILGFIFKRPEFMKEQENLKERLLGAFIMISGMLTIILFG